jgi:PAS domain S-box-containing protein
MGGDSLDRQEARAIGAALPCLHYANPDSLGRTQEVLAGQLVQDLAPDQVIALQPRLAALLGEVAAGFLSQARDAILVEQEQIRQALLAERDRIGAALRQSESGLAEAQRIAHIGHWEYDLVGDELRWSDEVYRIFGVTPQQFGATLDSYLAHLHPDDRLAVENAVQEAFGGGRFDIDHRVVRPDGEVRIVHQRGEVILDAAGRPGMILGTVHDITDRKVSEEHQYLQRFVAMISHELSQPLSILLGRVQMLQLLVGKETGNLTETEQRSLRAIEDSARRIDRLVGDVQDLVYIGANTFKVRPAPMDMAEAVRRIAEEQRLATDKHRLTVDAPGELRGEWDADRIGQLLTNLISNAVKYSPEGGEVRITALGVGGDVVLSVSDQGIGITLEDQRSLFRPFSRVGEGQIAGRGLGLYISKAIAESHGGRIRVESQPGEGSTFSVQLPAG